MGTYSAFSNYVERMSFKHATILAINENSIDINVDGVDWDGVDWRYNCQSGWVPDDPSIPYSVGDTVEIEWDDYLGEPHCVIGFPDGARRCLMHGLLIYTAYPSPDLRAYTLEAWINGDPIIVSKWETDGTPIDPPRNYRIILNDISIAYQNLDDYPSTYGRILDVKFAENNVYRIGVLVDRQISPYAEEDDEMRYTHLVLTYVVDPVTLELELEDYWGIVGQTGCQGGCSDADKLRNNPWCPGWLCQCGSDGARNGCFTCSTNYYWSYTVYADLPSPREYTYIDDLSSQSTGSCGGTCCGDCVQGFTPERIWLSSEQGTEPIIFATGRRTAHKMVMPGSNRTRSYTWDHPVSLTFLNTGVTQEGGVFHQYDETQYFDVTQVDRCYKARSRLSYTLSGYNYPAMIPPIEHIYEGDWGISQYGVGNCYNVVGQQIQAQLVRANPTAFTCDYLHNLLGDYHDELPYLELIYWSQKAGGAASEDRICLAPLGGECPSCDPSWSVSYDVVIPLSEESYFYRKYHSWQRGNCEDDSDPESGDLKTRGFSMTYPSNQDITPRYAFLLAMPEMALVWGRTTLNAPLFRSYTTAFTDTIHEVRCQEGQTNPNCYDPITAEMVADEDLGYDDEDLGYDRMWSMLIHPSGGGWIIRVVRDGTFDYSFRFYAFSKLTEVGGNEIVHSGSPSWSRSYESSFFEPKGHDVVVYDPSM